MHNRWVKVVIPILLLVSLLTASLALAETRNLRGALDATDNTYNRGGGPDCALLSGWGTDVYYDAYRINVTAPGTYSFEMMSGTIFDTYFFLYQGSFNPYSAYGCYAANDDYNGLWSYMEADLTPGVDYYFVITTYSNGDMGDYLVEVDGPGDIILPDWDSEETWDAGDARLNPDPAMEVAIYCVTDGIDLWGFSDNHFGYVSAAEFTAAPATDDAPFWTSADGTVRVYHLANDWWGVQKDQVRGDTTETYQYAWDGCPRTQSLTTVYDAAGNLLVYEVGP